MPNIQHETPWNFVYLRDKVLAYRATEEVNASLPEDFKKQFTVVSTISLDGEKYPPIFLATGTTNRCEQQFSDMKSEENDYLLFHSGSGKTDDQVMKFYLKQLKSWADDEDCVLVLDQYASHISDSTKDYARDLNIMLVYISVSATDIFQPLDKYIFGILKSQASSRIDDQSIDYQNALTKSEAADLFTELWNNL